MVSLDLAKRGIKDARVLEAFRLVQRERFVPEDLLGFAYEDSPLPIGQQQTISQPYIVALTVEALRLKGHERVLEIGTGSGYAAAILGKLAREVYTVERILSLATSARDRLARLGFDNVHVMHGDGTLGWPEHAPYDAIAVAAGGPRVPEALRAQLAIGGRLVIPVGPEGEQVLLEVIRESKDSFREREITEVRFVPLVGEQGWAEKSDIVSAPSRKPRLTNVSALVREVAEPITDLESGDVRALVDRVASAKVVLIGEASHGTSEFYRFRARITRELIARHGFSFVAVEGDWPDVAMIDEHVTGAKKKTLATTPFERFPTWMWGNREVADFVRWLRAYNASTPGSRKVGFHGLDLYSLFTSQAVVLDYLDKVDPAAAQVARARYGLLTPWQRDPAAYGAAVSRGRYDSCESHVVATLSELLKNRMEYVRHDGARFFDAAQNARVVVNAEGYYRAMYWGGHESWNLRDDHMFDTLRSLLAFYGSESKGVVWEHNSHVGDASATDMGRRGEHNVGQLAREALGDRVRIIGMGTDHGTVAAAHDWGDEMSVMSVRPSDRESHERIMHDARVPAFSLALREPRRDEVREELLTERLERAIGVIYRPRTELMSHYFMASLARQFDDYVWFDETSAVEPVDPSVLFAE